MTQVIDVRPLPPGEPLEVFDFTIRGHHRYLAAGVLVSNSKRIGILNVNAMLAHGALGALAEKGAVRGTRNEDYWLNVMLGHSPPEPGVSAAYRKFFDDLKGAGVNVVRDGTKLHLKGLTRDDVHGMTGDRLIKSHETVRIGTLNPVPGGLFDKGMTGGLGGKQWSAIPLDEPMPAPIMEEPLRRLLNLTKDQYEKTIAGEHSLPGFGTGPGAIGKALDRIDVAHELEVARGGLKASSATARDTARRKLGYLKMFAANELHPRDFMYDRVPVLPPALRPITHLPGGTPVVADPNFLYGDLVRANRNLGAVRTQAGDAHAGPERLGVYHAFKAVTGLGDPIGRKSRDKQVEGILKHVLGSSPKFSTVQRQLLSSNVDNVGRGVIVPDPDLDMDEIGLPEDIAFESYARFVTSRLVRRGLPPGEALKQLKDRTPLARKALVEEMDKRPVFADRAPVLHKFGVMGFRPVLTPGKVIRTSPLVVKGFGADFDGDAMQVHAASTDRGVQDAYNMMPSRHLLSPADFKTPMHAPGQSYQGGLYHATTAQDDRPPQTFATTADVLQALQRGEIDHSTPIEVLHPDN